MMGEPQQGFGAVGSEDTEEGGSSSSDEKQEILKQQLVEEVLQEQLEEKRSMIRAELWETEKSYVKSLWELKEFYEEPLKTNGILTREEWEIIFKGLEEVRLANKFLLKELRDASVDDVAMIFVQCAGMLKNYSRYINNFTASSELLKALMKNNKEFFNFVQAQAVQCTQYNITSYFIMPVQRLPRYSMLLEDLRKHTPENHPTRPTVELAITQIAGCADFVNAQKGKMEAEEKFYELSKKLENAILLMMPDRVLMKEGPALDFRMKRVQIFLFNDILIVAQKKNLLREMRKTLEMSASDYKKVRNERRKSKAKQKIARTRSADAANSVKPIEKRKHLFQETDRARISSETAILTDEQIIILQAKIGMRSRSISAGSDKYPLSARCENTTTVQKADPETCSTGAIQVQTNHYFGIREKEKWLIFSVPDRQTKDIWLGFLDQCLNKAKQK